MKQLIKLIIRADFFNDKGKHMKTNEVDCADANASRALGREIAQWLATGINYRVESTTIDIGRVSIG